MPTGYLVILLSSVVIVLIPSQPLPSYLLILLCTDFNLNGAPFLLQNVSETPAAEPVYLDS